MLWSKAIGAGGTLGGGAIALVGHATSSAIGTSPISVNLTSLIGGISTFAEEGDLVLIFSSVNAVSNSSFGAGNITSSGYTIAVDKYLGNSTYDVFLTVGYKVMSGTPDVSVALSNSSYSSGSQIAHIRVYRNVDAVTPMDTTPVITGGAGTAVDPLTITPTSTDYLIVAGGVICFDPTTSPSFTSSDLDNFVSTYVAQPAGFSGVSAWGDSTTIVNPAPFGRTNIGANMAYSNVSATIALRPA